MWEPVVRQVIVRWAGGPGLRHPAVGCDAACAGRLVIVCGRCENPVPGGGMSLPVWCRTVGGVGACGWLIVRSARYRWCHPGRPF